MSASTIAVREKAAVFRMPAFQHALPMLLVRAREAMSQRFRAAIHAHGLTEQQWRIIRALEEVTSIEVCELGHRCCMHPASLSRILPHLAALGLVSRTPNTADQRRVAVALTPRGRQLYESAMPEAERLYAALASDVGAERLEHVCAMLEELLAVLERTRSEDDSGSESRAPRKITRAGTGR